MRHCSPPLLTLFLCSLLVSLTLSDENILRIEEKLTTDKEFYEQWMHLIGLQAQELDEQNKDFPIDSEKTIRTLENCAITDGYYPDHVDYIRPFDVEIYAEIGHLARYCKHNYSTLQSGILDACQHRGFEMSEVSIDKMLKVFTPNMTIVNTNDRDAFLSQQAREVSETIREIDNYSNKWKLIVVMPTIQDGEASETGQTAVEVLAMIEELERQLPEKTLIVIVESSGKGIWQDASHSHAACRQMLTRWKLHTQYNSVSVWDQVIKIASKNFRKSNFSVEFLPLLKNASLTNLPDAMDLSVLGYDCAHFSSRGLSLLHTAVWNSLFTKAADRSRQFRAQPIQILCPDPRCPFIRTQTNSVMCIWNQMETFSSESPRLLIALAVLLIALLLSICICICLCLHRRQNDYVKKPSHSFGSNFSSIRFIDEDAGNIDS